MQKIVLFIEPNDDAFMTPFKLANLVMNLFYFEEKASFKIVKIFELGKSSFKMPLLESDSDSSRTLIDRIESNLNEGCYMSDYAIKQENQKLEERRNEKGMSLST